MSACKTPLRDRPLGIDYVFPYEALRKAAPW